MAVLDLVTYALVGGGVILTVPVAVLLGEIVAGLAPRRGAPVTTTAAPRLAVLMPAHDEALGIAETLRHVLLQLAPGDRLLVVADNCTDATAEIASAQGAEVIVRTDPDRRGKSYALQFGTRHLSQAPPDVVVILDADCRLDAGSLRTISARASEIGRPVQAHYELLAPPGTPSTGRAIAVFAAKVKNYLRPLGLYRLGLPCQLVGTGMAFPWHALASADVDSGELAEDLVLGLDLARSGQAAEFCPSARVTSLFPISAEGTRTQRARWETGHLTTIFRRVPGHILEAVRARNTALLALALDAAVPPLALQATALTAYFIAALLAATWGSYAPLTIATLAITAFGLAIVLAWNCVGRDNVTLAQLARAPAYIISKIPLYAQILRGKRISWIRSKRD